VRGHRDLHERLRFRHAQKQRQPGRPDPGESDQARQLAGLARQVGGEPSRPQSPVRGQLREQFSYIYE